MKFIDTHAHLYSNKFKEDRDNVIDNLIKSGVTKMFLPNISSEYTFSMLELCKKYQKNCFPMMGLHPCDVKIESMERELSCGRNVTKRTIYCNWRNRTRFILG